MIQFSPTEEAADSRHDIVAALRIIERMDEDVIETLLFKLKAHPFDKIQAWIKERSKQETQDVIYAEKGGYELVRIPAGSFMMGSDEFDNAQPVHEVHVSEFYMGRYPVTNEEYGRFMEANPGMEEPVYWGERKYNQSHQPVVGVSWNDAKRYAEWAGLHLPTEAQWEYACRAGTDTKYYTGDTEVDLDRAGWYKGNSDSKLHLVGEKEPNEWGLYDMHGNVYEWVEDDLHGSYKKAPSDGSAWVDDPRGSYRLARGGSWFNRAQDCRSASRHGDVPDSRFTYLGFRLVLLPGQPCIQA